MNGGTWFNVKVKYTKQLEDGRLKRVTEPYLIDSVSFTDAEARFYEEIGQNILGDYSITGIAKKDYMDIFYYEDADDWYECKLTYISIDEEEGKDKKIKCNFLVTASSVKEACSRIDESLSDMMVSYDITAVTITTITEVLPYNPGEKDIPEDSNTADEAPIPEATASIVKDHTNKNASDEEE